MRICCVDTCIFTVSGTDKNTKKGYCARHQYLRTDKSLLIAKRSHKPNHKPSFGFESQPDLFAWCWDNAKDQKGMVTCPFTGEKLNRFLNEAEILQCFAHILPKGKYPYFKLNPKNIAVVYPEFHSIVDQGTSIDRANHPAWRFDLWDQRVEEMKIQYKLFKKQNLLP